MSHFYLTLPSNSSTEYYPNNILTNYTTKLAVEVSLRGEWEVGLPEIIFPKNWLNLPEDQTLEVVLKRPSAVESRREGGRVCRRRPPAAGAVAACAREYISGSINTYFLACSM